MKTSKDFAEAKQRAEAAEHRGLPDKNWTRVQQIGIAGVALGAVIALANSFLTSGNIKTNSNHISDISEQVSTMDERMAAQQKCMDKRRAYYVNAERDWFYAIDRAEHMPVLSPKRFTVRINAFDARMKSFPIYDHWKCPLDTTTGTPVPRPF